MAFDNENVVVLEIEDGRSAETVKRANAGLDSVDQKAAAVSKSASHSFEQMGDTVVRTMDRSRSSIERLVTAAEKKAGGAGASKLQQLISERDLAIGRVQGDPKAVDRITAAYTRLISVQKQADNTALLERAQAASKKAEQATLAFSRALQQTNQAAKDAETSIARSAEVSQQRWMGAAVAIAAMAAAMQIAVVGTALYAARTETLGVAVEAVAKANNVSVIGLREQERQMKNLGISTQEARSSLTQIVAAQLDYTKAAKLARLAQDAAVVGNVNSSEALQALTHGIVSQQTDVLRTIGIQVDFEKAFQKTAKTLGRTSESLTAVEKKQIAFNEVLAQAPKFAGIYESAMGTAGKQMTSLKRLVDEARNAIGEGFLPAVSTVVQVLTNSLSHMQKHGDMYGFIAKSATVAIGALLAVKTAAFGLGAFGIAVNPVLAITIGLLTALGAVWLLSQDRLTTQRTAIENHIGSLASQREALRAAGLGAKDYADQLAEIDKRAIAAELSLARINAEVKRSFSEKGRTIAMAGVPIQLPGRVPVGTVDGKQFFEGDTQRIPESYFINQRKKADKAVEAAALTEKQLSAEKQAHELLRDAMKSEVGGMERLKIEREDALRQYGLTAKAIREINAAFKIRERTESEKIREERQEADRVLNSLSGDRLQRTLKPLLDPLQGKTLETYQQSYELAKDTADRSADYESRVAAQTRDARLRGIELEAMQIDQRNKNAASQKAALEAAKLQIEQEYIIRSAALEAEKIKRSMDRQIEQLQKLYDLQLITQDAFDAKRDALIRDAAERAGDVEKDAIASVEAARGDSYIRTSEIFRNAHEQAFESTKRSFESLLDEMFSTSRTWGDKMKAILNAALLQPLKDIAGTLFASVMTGGNRQVGQSSGGLLGGLLGGLMTAGGGFGVPGAPGGTGGFAGPVQQSGVGLGGSAIQGVGLLGGFKGAGGGLLGMLRSLGNIGRPVLGPGSSGGAFGGSGFGGVTGGAMLAGGGLLAFDGLRRGGLVGLGETTAGGALIGAKFGGPIGALIGGAVGALAGFVRLFVKGAQEKLQAKIKAVYGVDIADKGLLKQFMETIKSQFGGNIDLGIQSPQIRDLIELYAMSTGQGDKFPVQNKMRPLFLNQIGGNLFQSPSYENGRSIGMNGGLPFLNSVDRLVDPAGASTTVVVQLDGPATTSVLRGEAVSVMVDNPALVSRQNVTGQQASSGRKESAAMTFGVVGLVVG